MKFDQNSGSKEKGFYEALAAVQRRSKVRNINDYLAERVLDFSQKLQTACPNVKFEYVGCCPSYKGGGYSGDLVSTVVVFSPGGLGDVGRSQRLSMWDWRVQPEFRYRLTAEDKAQLVDLGFEVRGGQWVYTKDWSKA
jgi:hypothetical protein